MSLYAARHEPLGDRLHLRLDPGGFARQAELRLPVVDTGENGVFTKGEFEAITAMGQMEFVTPEEIARLCVQEIAGRNTGRDVISAIDAAVLGPLLPGRRAALPGARGAALPGGAHRHPQRRPGPAGPAGAVQAALGGGAARPDRRHPARRPGGHAPRR